MPQAKPTLLDDSNFPFLAKYKNLNAPNKFLYLAVLAIVGTIIAFFTVPLGTTFVYITLGLSFLLFIIALFGGAISADTQALVIKQYHNVPFNEQTDAWKKATLKTWKEEQKYFLLNPTKKSYLYDIVDDTNFPFAAKYKNLDFALKLVYMTTAIFVLACITIICSAIPPVFSFSLLIGFVLLGLSLVLLGVICWFLPYQDKLARKYHKLKSRNSVNPESLLDVHYFWLTAIKKAERDYLNARKANTKTVNDSTDTKVTKSKAKSSSEVSIIVAKANDVTSLLPVNIQKTLTSTLKTLDKALNESNKTVEDEYFIETSLNGYVDELLTLYTDLPKRLRRHDSEETAILEINLRKIKAQAKNIIRKSEEEKVKAFTAYDKFLTETLD